MANIFSKPAFLVGLAAIPGEQRAAVMQGKLPIIKLI
jgi:hypothetical protein